MKVEYKKILKLVTLLITSLLIGFVSAGTYSQLYMNATPITVGAAQLKFTLGANTTGIGSINSEGTVVTFTGMTVDISQTQTYEQAVNITNQASTAKTINLTLSSLTGQFSANFDYINITIFDASGSKQGSSIYISSTSGNVTETGGISMPGGNTVWTVQWIIKASSGASSGATINVALIMKVE